MIQVFSPSGIGDAYWLLMKVLPNTNKRIHLRVPPGNSEVYKRSSFLCSIDRVEKVTADGLPYTALIHKAKEFSYKKIEKVMYLEANTWLESGKHIEDYMPGFINSYRLNWLITKDEYQKAISFFSPSKKNIVIYTSSLQNNRKVKNWNSDFWKVLISRLYKSVNLIWIGAEYDSDILEQFKGFNLNTVINESPGVILSLLRNCTGFISYQSGLSCISVAESIPTFMLYFRHIEKLSYSICPKTSLNNSVLYYRAFFDSVYTTQIESWINSL